MRITHSFCYLLLAVGWAAMACKTIKTTTTTTNTNTEPKVVVVEPQPEPEPEPEPIQKTSPMNPNQPMPKATAESPIVVLTTDLGDIEIQLFAETPQHRDNFLKLVKEGFYNDLLFHRIIKNFMIQGGDPDSRNAAAGVQLGMGGPGYTVPAELIREHIHIKGALAAARQGDQVNPQKRSSGSQFYIVQGAPVQQNMLDMIQSRKGFIYTAEEIELYKTIGGTPHLDGDYTVFGRVIKGLDIIDKIAAQPTLPGDRPATDIKMKVQVKE